MKSYAIIEVNGGQEKVSVGDIVNVRGHFDAETVTFDKVLAIVGENSAFGAPFVDKSEVKGSVVAKTQGKKVRVAKFKAKSKYHNVQGYRTVFTQVRITEIA